MGTLGMVQEAKIVVGLDFGTSYSGFAYALRTDPEKVYTFYAWPMQSEGGGPQYCKTPTSLLYADASDPSDDPFELQGWGWPAFLKYKPANPRVAESDNTAPDSDYEVVDDFEELKPSSPGTSESQSTPPPSQSCRGHLLTLFKLHLATNDAAMASNVPALPPGMTARRAIANFLSEIAKFILEELRNKFGPHITLGDVQWCLTVPAIWDEEAKREMRTCADIAGLVQGPLSKKGGSPHQLKLFIEPEAASVYCQQKLKQWQWNKGDKFLVVDCGGGTVDLILHEKLAAAPTLSVREVQASSGDFCGGSRVDDEFIRFMRRNISCFKEFEKQHPATLQAFRKTWEDIKDEFNGENGDRHVELPPVLASMWENQGATSTMIQSSSAIVSTYDEVKVTNDDMKAMFDPVVGRILELIEERIVSDLHAIVVVGGFSQSPYLMKRIRDAFGGRVAYIERPLDPGSAVCCGAVTMGMKSDLVVSRISKKTYGFRQAEPFISGVHSEFFKVEGDAGRFYCSNVFGTYVRKGDEVRFDDCVQNTYFPISESQKELNIDLYSSDYENVRFISDVGSRKEGTFNIGIPTSEELGFKPKVEVSMFFGRTEVEVNAVGKNFNSEKKEMLTIKFEWNGIY